MRRAKHALHRKHIGLTMLVEPPSPLRTARYEESSSPDDQAGASNQRGRNACQPGAGKREAEYEPEQPFPMRRGGGALVGSAAVSTWVDRHGTHVSRRDRHRPLPANDH